MEKNKKIASFTGLRFIMIIVIVYCHFEFLSTLEGFGVYKQYLSNPTFAVDFFFLLSGFGMMIGSLSRIEDSSLKFPSPLQCIKYAVKHVKKIYPVYIATIAFGLLYRIAVVVFKSKDYMTFFTDNIFKLIINTLLLQSATGSMPYTHIYNGVAWFLSSLFCIYLVSPVAILILRKISKSYFSDIVLLILNIFMIGFSAYICDKIEVQLSLDYLTYASPYRRLFYVLTGMNTALLFNRIKQTDFLQKKNTMNCLEIIISLFVIAWYFSRNSFEDGIYKYIIDVVLCAIFIFIFAFDTGIISNLMGKNELQKLGNMAMYIFLIHYPIRAYFGAVVEKFYGWNYISSFCFIIFVLLSTFAISFIVYRIQNKPERQDENIKVK